MMITSKRLIILGLIGVFFAQIIFYFPNLGETVATHFDALGRPNGAMPKRFFLTFEIALLLLIVSEALLIPLLIERIPERFLNIPNRGYWLAEERRAATFAGMRSAFESLGVLLVAFFVVVNQLVFNANVRRANLEVWQFIVVFIVFVGAMVIWLLRFVKMFRIPKNES